MKIQRFYQLYPSGAIRAVEDLFVSLTAFSFIFNPYRGLAGHGFYQRADIFG
jgi:hypothetical protein